MCCEKLSITRLIRSKDRFGQIGCENRRLFRGVERSYRVVNRINRLPYLVQGSVLFDCEGGEPFGQTGSSLVVCLLFVWGYLGVSVRELGIWLIFRLQGIIDCLGLLERREIGDCKVGVFISAGE
jgi:hypothetical protein